MVASTVWASSVGFGWTWPPGPQNQGMLGHPGAITMILLHGESCNITVCPIWLKEGRCMLPDPATTDWAHPLLWPGDPAPVIQTKANCCRIKWQIGLFKAGATCCILLGRPPEGETTLLGWSGLAWVPCLLPHSADLECVRLWVTWLLVHQIKILHSRAQGGPDLMPPSLFMFDTTVVLSVPTSTILCMQRPLTLLRLDMLPWVLGNWYATCFPEGTRCFLQCVRLSERPTLLLMHLLTFADVLLGCNDRPARTSSSCSHHCKCGCNDLGIGITISSNSGTLQMIVRCHCMGLLWSGPRWTCFPMAVTKPIRHELLDRTSQYWQYF